MFADTEREIRESRPFVNLTVHSLKNGLQYDNMIYTSEEDYLDNKDAERVPVGFYATNAESVIEVRCILNSKNIGTKIISKERNTLLYYELRRLISVKKVEKWMLNK